MHAYYLIKCNALYRCLTYLNANSINGGAARESSSDVGLGTGLYKHSAYEYRD